MQKPNRTVASRLGLAACLCSGAAQAGQDLVVLAAPDALRLWQPAGPATPAPWPTSIPVDAGGACVHLGFRIDARGHTADFTVLRRWSSGSSDAVATRHRLDEFARSAAAAVSTWRFTPVGGRPRQVYTSANVGFGPSPAAQETIAHCMVEDLPRFVADAQRGVGQRGSLMQALMDINRVSYPPQIPYDKHDWFDGPLGPGVQ